MYRFDHFAFQVGDLDAALRFYVEKLGFELSFRATDLVQQEEFAFLALGDLRLELLRDLSLSRFEKPEIQAPFCPHLAIKTDDLQRSLAQLREQGVRIVKGPMEIPGEVTWAYFADPDNNILELVEWHIKE